MTAAAALFAVVGLVCLVFSWALQRTAHREFALARKEASYAFKQRLEALATLGAAIEIYQRSKRPAPVAESEEKR